LRESNRDCIHNHNLIEKSAKHLGVLWKGSFRGSDPSSATTAPPRIILSL
jgi:hypothetical protein